MCPVEILLGIILPQFVLTQRERAVPCRGRLPSRMNTAKCPLSKTYDLKYMPQKGATIRQFIDLGHYAFPYYLRSLFAKTSFYLLNLLFENSFMLLDILVRLLR